MKLFLVSILFTFSAFAFGAELFIWNFVKNDFSKFCSAEKVRPGLYLTAFHCINQFDDKEIIVLDRESMLLVESVLEHPYYRPQFSSNQFDFVFFYTKDANRDFSILKMKREIRIGEQLIFNKRIGIVKGITKTEFVVHFKDGDLCLGDSGRGIKNSSGEVMGILSRGARNCKDFGVFSKLNYILNAFYGLENIGQDFDKEKKNLIYKITGRRNGN